jgi:hypothetical protein
VLETVKKPMGKLSGVLKPAPRRCETMALPGRRILQRLQFFMERRKT